MCGHGYIGVGSLQIVALLDGLTKSGLGKVHMVNVGARSRRALRRRNRNEQEQSKQQGAGAFQGFLQVFDSGSIGRVLGQRNEGIIGVVGGFVQGDRGQIRRGGDNLAKVHTQSRHSLSLD